jgi:hypothetical protein
MKAKIEIDASPEELRRFFGLPDIQELQQELIEKVREKMAAGYDGFDPASLLKSSLPENLQSLTTLQKQFWETMLGSNTAKNKETDK